MCATCGNTDIIYNQHKQIYQCDVCQQDSEIVKYKSTWSNNVFNKECEALGIGVKFITTPKEYYVK
jgi:hypothetical protein